MSEPLFSSLSDFLSSGGFFSPPEVSRLSARIFASPEGQEKFKEILSKCQTEDGGQQQNNEEFYEFCRGLLSLDGPTGRLFGHRPVHFASLERFVEFSIFRHEICSLSESFSSLPTSFSHVLLYSFRLFVSPAALWRFLVDFHTWASKVEEFLGENSEKSGDFSDCLLDWSLELPPQSARLVCFKLVNFLLLWVKEIPEDFSASRAETTKFINERKNEENHEDIEIALAALASLPVAEDFLSSSSPPSFPDFSPGPVEAPDFSASSVEIINADNQYSLASLIIPPEVALINDSQAFFGIDLLALSTFDVCRELTLMDYQILSGIRLLDVLEGKFRSKAGESSFRPNAYGFPVFSIVNHFNFLVQWISSELLDRKSPSQRSECLAFFIECADICRDKIYNFHLAFAIAAALNSHAVYRLIEKRADGSGDGIPINAEMARSMAELKDFTAPDGNYANYRAFLTLSTRHQFPFIPHFAILLKDLTIIHEAAKARGDQANTQNSSEEDRRKTFPPNSQFPRPTLPGSSVDLLLATRLAHDLRSVFLSARHRNFFRYFPSHGLIRNSLRQQIWRKTKSEKFLEETSYKMKNRKK